MTRATLTLASICNNHCVFCARDGLDAAHLAAADVAAALAAARAAHDEVTFVGAEPTLHPGLADAVRSARAAGFARVGVQTNGRLFAHRPSLAALVDAGLTDAHVSVQGASAAVHDYHTEAPGSFAQTLAGVAHARAAGVTVVVDTVLTRSNFRVLGELPRLLHARGAAAWCVSVPHVAGRVASAFDRVHPRLGLALPFALHALATANELGLAAFVRGAPSCALGPFASRALPAPARAFGEACDGCAARPGCAGLDPHYLARFGGDELAARGAPVAVAQPEPAHLARMFVGPGPLAHSPAELAAVAPPPARVRVALPVLGRVQPAHGEVPAGSAKRTGEALREILPGLFEDEGK